MARKILLPVAAVLFLISLCAAAVSSGPSSYFSEQDKESAINRILSAQKSDGSFFGLKNTFYAVSALSNLKAEIPEKAKVCEFTKGSLKVYDAETIFYHSSILEQLKCGQKADEKVKDALKKALKSDSIHNLYYGVSAALLLKKNKHLDLTEKEIQDVIDRILEREDEGVFKRTEDDSFISVLYSGLALDALGQIAKDIKLPAASKETLTTLLSNSENILSLGEEKDGALYFMDDEIQASSIQVTSAVIRGINVLSSALKTKVDAFTEEEAVQIAQVFIRSKASASLEDLYFTLDGLTHSASNQYTPLVVSLAQQSLSSSGKEGKIQVRVTDLFGNFATKAKVTLVKAALSTNEAQAVLANKELTPEADKIAYQLDFLAAKPDLGFYQLEFSVVPTDKGSFVGVEKAVHSLKVIGAATVSDVRFSVTESEDADDTEGRKFKPVVGSKLKDKITASEGQHLHVRFSVKSDVTSKPVQVHQAFLRISKGDLETFVPARYVKNAYAIHVPVKNLAGEFYGESGAYSLELIVGDAFLQTPVAWNLADVSLTFSEELKAKRTPSPFRSLPTIEHQFRVPEPRPPKTLSLAFTAIVLSPLLVLVVGLAIVGPNLSNFPSLSGFIWAVGFQSTLGCILLIFVIYWLRLTMIQTLGYLGALAVPFLFFSQRHLSSLAKQKAE